MRLMLDTNAYSAFMRGDAAVAELIARADEILLPVPVLAELRAGFRLGNREPANLRELERFLASPRVRAFPATETSAVFYAETYCALRAAGNPIPGNDLWIAALALESGSMLVTADAHFAAVKGLLLAPAAGLG